jgi:hypothetical protein
LGEESESGTSPKYLKFKKEKNMKIKMKQDKVASSNENGTTTMTYAKDSVHDMSSEWQMKLATNFINNGRAESVSVETTKKVIVDMEKKEEKKEVKKSIVKKLFGKKK